MSDPFLPPSAPPAQTPDPSAPQTIQSLEYASPQRGEAAMGWTLRAGLAGLAVIAGLLLCAEGRERDRQGMVLLGFGCVVAGIFGYIATGPPPRRRVPGAWGVQVVLAVVVCLFGTLQLMVSLSDGIYELRRGRWDAGFVQALGILGGGVAWFAAVRFGLRRHWARAEPLDGEAPAIPSARTYRRRAWSMGLAVFLVACAITAYDVISYKVRIWREYQTCATYLAPVDQVVLTEDPAEAATLLQSGRGYDEVAFSGPNYLYYRDERRAQLGSPFLNTALPGWWSNCVPFLHARTARDGKAQIVIVTLRALKQQKEDAHRIMELRPFTMELQSWPNAQQVYPESAGGVLTFPLGATDQLRVFAGQLDPADPSHFTIRYQLNGREGFVDGWLDPGRRVRLTDHAGPHDGSQ